MVLTIFVLFPINGQGCLTLVVSLALYRPAHLLTRSPVSESAGVKFIMNLQFAQVIIEPAMNGRVELTRRGKMLLG